MKIIEVFIKSSGRKGNVQQFDSVREALEQLGEEGCRTLMNAQLVLKKRQELQREENKYRTKLKRIAGNVATSICQDPENDEAYTQFMRRMEEEEKGLKQGE